MNKVNETNKRRTGFRSIKDILAETPEEITSWGNWKLNKEYQVLELLIDGEWKTEIDLERCTTPKETWHCVLGLDSKSWITSHDIADAIEALRYLIGYKGYWSK